MGHEFEQLANRIHRYNKSGGDMVSGNWLERTKGVGKSNDETSISGTKESYWCSIRIKSLKGGQNCSSRISTYVHSINTSKVYRPVDGGSYKGVGSVGTINKTSQR